MTGMSYALIRGWLSGTSKISPSHALALSRELGVMPECLIANEVGPCLMQDGQTATMDLIDEWKNRRPNIDAVNALAARAGLLMKELVLIASKENRLAYREVLQAMSDLVMKYGEAKALSEKIRPVVSCRIDEIEEKYRDIWKLIEGDQDVKALRASVNNYKMVSMVWTTSEMMHALTKGKIDNEMRSRTFNEVERFVIHNVVLKSGEVTINIERKHWYFSLPIDPIDPRSPLISQDTGTDKGTK